jgi:uncharacterized membrane protein
MPDAPRSARRPRRYDHESLEFERIAFFSDAIFAIALTLLVTGLDVPRIAGETSASELWTALGDESSGILMFFISVAVIGGFWLNHHRFVGRLRAMDGTLASAGLVYLAFIAFLPFPSAVLGDYTDNPVGVSLYAVTIIVVALSASALEEIADRHELRADRLSPEAVRWRRIASAVPIAIFAASIAVAFGISAVLGVYSWLLLIPTGRFVAHMMPAPVVDSLES